MLRVIGRGSYGDVWLARGVTGVFRAVKIVWRDRFPDLRPYEREFEGITRFAAISVREPSQLALLHAGRQDAAGFFYYVMELADDVARGREIDPDSYVPLTLKDYAARRRPRVETAEAVALGVTLARALASLHAAGLVHRDIKPSNVVLIGGVPKLADVGLVAMASAGLTFVGTEGFVPPEGPGAPSADVYSLGKLLYELATGLDRHDWPRLPPDLDRRPDQRALLELNEVLVRACEPDPRERFPDATALLEELLLLQAGKSVRRLRRAERHTARALRIAIVLALVAGLAGAGAYVERQRANSADVQRRKAEAQRDAYVRQEIYSTALVQSGRALEQGDYGRARQFLGSNPPGPGEPDPRGFEWRALWNDAQGDRAEILRATGTGGLSVRFSPATNLIAVSTEENEAILWDATSRRELRRIKGVRRMVGFSRDGQWLVGVAPPPLPPDRKRTPGPVGSQLRRWRTDDGTPDLRPGPRASWAFGPTNDNLWVAIGFTAIDETHYVRGIDLETARETWQQPIPYTGSAGGESYYSGALAPDGRTLALTLVQNRKRPAGWRLLVLTLPDLKMVWNEETDHRPAVVTFGPDGTSLVVASDDTNEVSLLDLTTRQPRWRTVVPISRMTTLTHDGRNSLVVGGRSASLALLDLATGALLGTKRGHEVDAQDVQFLADGWLVSTGAGGDVRLWSAREDRRPFEFPGFWNPPSGGRALAVSSDGRLVAATASATGVRLVSTASAQTVAELDAMLPVGFSADGRSVWTTTEECFLQCHLLTEPAEPRQKIALPFTATMAAIADNGSQIICADYTNDWLVFFDVDRGTVSPEFKTGHGFIYWLALSPDGQRAATCGRDLMVRLWDVASGRQTVAWKVPGQMNNGVFSPDGRQLAMVQSTGVLEVRDLTGDAPPVRVLTTSGILQGIAFHPTEPRVFLGGRNGIVHVIDTRRWKEIAQLPAGLSSTKPGTMVRIAVAADGQTLAVYAEAGVIRLWRSAAEK